LFIRKSLEQNFQDEHLANYLF